MKKYILALALSSLVGLTYSALTHAAPYTVCQDDDGNGEGHVQGNESQACNIPPRFDLANQSGFWGSFSVAFEALSFDITAVPCSTYESFTGRRGCFTTTYSQNPDFQEFAAHNEFSQYGALSKFHPAGNNTHPLDKVMVIVGPHNSTGFPNVENEIMWLVNKSRNSHLSNLFQYLHREGVSVLYVSFNHPTSNLLPVEDSSRALVSALNQFNQFRKNAPQAHQEPLNLLGLSAGGVISRFALSKIEKQGGSHDVGIYMSMDSPHFGANVPASLQAIPLFLRDAFSYADRKTDTPWVLDLMMPFSIGYAYLFDRLNNAVSEANDAFQLSTSAANDAALQALGSIPSKELISFNALFKDSDFRSPEHTSFLNSIRIHPMPSQTKVNIGITNGSLRGNLNESGNAVVVEGSALDEYISLRTKEKHGTRLSFTSKPAGTGIGPYFSGTLSFPNRNALYLTDRSYTQKWTNNSLQFSRDLAPCSTTDEVVDTLVSQLDKAIRKFWKTSSVEVTKNTSCFIPVGSALAMNVRSPMLFNQAATASQSQFDEIIGSDRNSPHLYFSSDITLKMIDSLRRHRSKPSDSVSPNNDQAPVNSPSISGLNNLRIQRYSQTSAEIFWDQKPGFDLSRIDLTYHSTGAGISSAPVGAKTYIGSRSSAFLNNVVGNELQIVIKPQFVNSPSNTQKTHSLILPAAR